MYNGYKTHIFSRFDSQLTNSSLKVLSSKNDVVDSSFIGLVIIKE
jgi:hypothetical protein